MPLVDDGRSARHPLDAVRVRITIGEDQEQST